MGVLRDLMRWRPLTEGALAPPLSLTADDGTWIKIRDFEDSLNIVLVFFGEESEALEGFLRELEDQRERLEKLHTVVFGVNTNRIDRLREIRARLRLGFHLIYDPLALTGRAFGASRRVLPFCREVVYVLDKHQKVAFAHKGLPQVADVVAAVGRLEGVDVAAEAAKAAAAAAPAWSPTRDPGKPAAVVREIDSRKAEALLDGQGSVYKLVDVRTLSEFEADRSPDARRIQVDELPHRYHELGQTNFLIFVCQAGDRAAAAAEFMTSIGGNEIYAVTGGMTAWEGRRTSGPLDTPKEG